MASAPPEGPAQLTRQTNHVDGDTVKIGAWLTKARTQHGAGGLPDEHEARAAVASTGGAGPRIGNCRQRDTGQ